MWSLCGGRLSWLKEKPALDKAEQKTLPQAKKKPPCFHHLLLENSGKFSKQLKFDNAGPDLE